MTKKLTILYVHGFASAYDPTSSKVKALEELGNVIGKTIDYARTKGEVEHEIIQLIRNNNVDLVVGCSIGGYHAINAGARTGIPVVALNPSMFPERAMAGRIGVVGENYVTGETFVITQEHADSYIKSRFNADAFCLVLLDSDDDVIDPAATLITIEGVFAHAVFAGGSHRFEHMTEALPLIRVHLNKAEVSYGAGK